MMIGGWVRRGRVEGVGEGEREGQPKGGGAKGSITQNFASARYA